MTRPPALLPRMEEYPLSSTSAQFLSRALSQSQRIERLRRSFGNTRQSHEARRRRFLRQQYLDDQQNLSGRVPEGPGKRRKIEEPTAQSEMAHLQLELVYCDGGTFQDNLPSPRIVLDDNNEVYCTRSSHCNMIFQHAGEKCFTLEKIVIRGPLAGYTSPVKEGCIYVTMEKGDFLTQCNELKRLDDEDNDGEDQGESDDDEDYEDEDADINDIDFSLLEPCEHTPAARTSRMSLPRIEFSGSAVENQVAPIQPSARFCISRDEAVSKMKATITFDPPLSGRYILTKFYSRNREDNIDIEFIGAYGYVGRRFVPAVAMR